jgi:hypothetical protein
VAPRGAGADLTLWARTAEWAPLRTDLDLRSDPFSNQPARSGVDDCFAGTSRIHLATRHRSPAARDRRGRTPSQRAPLPTGRRPPVLVVLVGSAPAGGPTSHAKVEISIREQLVGHWVGDDLDIRIDEDDVQANDDSRRPFQ